ncbi:DUF4124 domain-containing protein [Pseudoxanthomonas mexicana]|uniref:DUF4124 domain-containing protein n=1 Tax=Pseudoxanthomonas mexicana TaxID=128785 RepID=UPI00398AA301
MHAIARPRLLPACALLGLLCLGAPALAGTVYQWKDANGVTHYSDKPPAGEKYQDRRIDNRGGTTQAAVPAGKSVENPQCTTARRNLELLQGDAPVHQTGEDGKSTGQPLDATQRANQRTLAEAAVKAYCTN